MLTATPRALHHLKLLIWLRNSILPYFNPCHPVAFCYDGFMRLQLSDSMTNQEVAAAFEFTAQILEAKAADPFRIRAYENAAATIKAHPQPLKKMYQAKQDFSKIPGIGQSFKKKLETLYQKGDVPALQKYVADVPAGTLPLTKLHGVGGKTALKLAQKFKLNQAENAYQKLLAAAKNGKIRNLEGFGQKSEADLIRRLQLATNSNKKRMSYKEAKTKANKIIKHLIKNKNVLTIEVLGSIRRQTETIGDIDLGLVIKNIGPVKTDMKRMKNVKKFLVSGEKLFRVLLKDNTQVDLKISPPEEWGSFLQHFTGSKEHNIKLRQYALAEKNFSLSEHGIKVLTPNTKQPPKILKFADEKEFYYALDLDWIPPEERIGKDEIKRYKQVKH